MREFFDFDCRKMGEKGFTLVELILVMTILGILAGMAVPRFVGVLDAAKEKADQANMKIVKEAAELWYMQTGQSGPVPAGDGEKLDSEAFGKEAEEKLVPDYLKEVPTNPMGTGDYLLKIDGQGKAVVSHEKDPLETPAEK
ncbi:MAG: type II secretion system protein [Syntrophomonas sp.]|uniref:competence type IV pilus major pilin ComGC n=1 Tax=Syntrophomonas sp. TaxID=2053627 RepID=UPI0026054790|nr:type II secretion system protein [Syntrophomonas sp.]MDD2510224.1 type II secretion system protein [Syntrophomonas sp.]MDD3879977.1 type II secretion system protein [Syntrophomonas sp.]MDD4627163.1 type II secretion system protein [Syntrophomonas sp.]